MYKDEVITEVWKNRETYAKHHHHNLDEIIADLKARQKESGRKVVERRLMTDKQVPELERTHD